MFFSQDWRERIKTENPDAGFGRFDPSNVGVVELRAFLQVRLASFSEPSGKSSTRTRKRSVAPSQR